ncbi:MAG TPA: DUF3617 family protein [Bryobacteraceae bacterium]|nr:DUF3617 family protein [Bryobacteraceae bacterium]
MRILPIAMTAALLLPLARATDPPEVKEGLWSVHMQFTDNPGNKKTEGSYSLCRDHAYDQRARARAKQIPGCTVTSENSAGGKYTVEMRCVKMGSTIEGKSVTTILSDTTVHSESHSTTNPPLAGVSEQTVVMDQKYTGSCPAGAKPGDRINSDGSIMHLGGR